MFRTIVAGIAGLAVLAAATVADGAGAGAPSRTTIKAVSTGSSIQPNRHIQDGLRWDKDVYKVKSGGTLKIVNVFAEEGPHTFTVVKRSDLPKPGPLRGCSICDKLGKAHGADPHSGAPPKFAFLENGVGQDTPPNVDRPGDSGVTGPGKKNESITLKVTAKKGTTLYFMCLIHPWMEAKLLVK